MNHSLKSLHISILFLVLFLTTQLSATIVGTTKGEFSVNQGTANYNLKIDVPPGVAGMEPKLSLNYSSSGGNGYMGIGWGIGGVSAITRCPQTKAVDGANHKFGVKYDANDRFCLDGQRLINVRGAYGADGTEYRTEIDTYSKITQKGIYGSSKGPNWFEVKTKSGLTYRYGIYGGTGGNASAYIVINKHKVFWKVNDITDTYGNKITFHYKNNYTTGENYLDKVTYAGNTVDYVYESRVDKKLGYSGGHQMNMSVRLKEVIVKTGTQEVRRYKFRYTRGSTGGSASKLTFITEQVPEGDLKKLSMSYQDVTGKLKKSSKAPATKTKDAHYVDLNGDGCVDVYNNNKWIAGDCKGGWTGGWKPTGTNVKNSEIKFADFDGDGDIDFIAKVSSSNIDIKTVIEGHYGKKIKSFQFIPPGVLQPEFPAGFSVYFQDGTSTFVPIGTYYYSVYTNDGKGTFLQSSLSTMGTRKMSEIKLGDFNHDSKMDILMKDNILLQTGNYFWQTKKLTFSTSNYDEIILQDINADGLVDIYEVDEGNDIVHFNNGNMTFTKKDYVPVFTENYDIKFADLNGDGAVDIYQVVSGADKIWINDGKGNFTQRYSPNVDASSNDLRLVDLNGDGYPDLYDIDNGNDNIWLNDGKGNFPSKTYELPVFCTPENLHFADINGDGITDMVEADDTNRIWFNQAKKPLLTRITNNTDQDIKIDYKHMTNSVIYHNYSTHGDRNKHAFNNIANDNIELTTSQSLVYSVNSANGVGGYNQIRYRYYGYVINKLRGSQGFHAIDTYDDTSRMKSVVFYDQITQPNGVGFWYAGMPAHSYTGLEYGTAWDYWLSKTDIIYRDASTHSGSRAKIYEPYTFSNVQTIHEPGTTTPIKAVYHNNYLNTDGLGNINKTVDRTYDFVNKKNFYKTTYNEYKAENQSKWYIGRLTKAKVVHSQTDGGTVVRSSTFKYNTKGVLSEEVANAGTSLALKKTYTYDAKGNKISETVSGANIITAQTRYDYGTQYGGKFLTHIDYADGTYQKIPTYDARFGTATSMIDANDLKTTWTYDGMGRKTKETRADGTWSKWEHLWCGTGDIKSRYVYWVKQTQSGTGYSTATFYDSLGRETSKHTSTLGAKRVLRYKDYNAKGELYAESLPYINGQDTRTYIRSYYDKYGRATKVTKPGPNGSTQTYSTYHKNFTSIVTDAKGIRKATVQNAIGQTIHITDAYGTSAASGIVYKYDAAGNLLSTTDAAGNVITMKYDAAGNKTYMKDPDLGVWNYRYFPTGKLRYQWSGTAGTAASKQFTYKTYDVLGRLIKTNTYDRPSYFSDKATYTFNYKSFKYGDASAAVGTRGKMIEAYANSRIGGNDLKREKKTMTYDSLGRPKSTNTYIYGRGDYLTSTTYDAYSRPSTITYPNGYKVKNVYDGVIGVLKSVVGTDTKGNVTNHYTINALTAFGEISDATFGNKVRTAIGHDSAGFVGSILSGQNGSYYSGNVQQVRYTYDALGNVLTRNDDSVTGKYIRDTFTYDAMNRLYAQNTDSNINGNYAKSKIYRYDKLGNMTHNYSYKGEHRSGGYLYGDHIGKYVYYADKPHAVKSAGSRSYTYDDVGNMTNRNGDTITYNPLNKPAILKNGKNGKEVRFYYGVGGQRFMKTTAEKQTFYLGKAYEEEQKVGSKEVKSTVYITVGGKAVGTHVEVLDKTYVSSNAKYKSTYNRYFHADALGSITAITNDVGTVVERRSYEPFGKIRAMDYGTNNNTLANTVTQTARAFTGHEQIAELSGLIHMNARVYDSDIGRFLSADTIIQAPHDSQSYNRYSYVRNNPLMFTDPSGHSWFSKLWKKIKNVVIGVVVAVLAVATAGAVLGAFGFTAWGGVSAAALATQAGAYGFAALVASGAAAGFVAGAAMGLLSGASLGQSLRMGLKGAVFGAVGAGVANIIGSAWGMSTSFGAKAGRAILHGLSRAAISKAQGGRWSAGFWSGFAGSALAPFAGRSTAGAAIVGGTASELGGGKFANGAVSAAFVHMYNYKAHLPKWAPPKSTERTELIPRILNNSVRFVLSAVDVIGEAISGAAQGLHQIMTMDSAQIKGGLIGQGLYESLTLKIGAGSGSAIGYEIVPSQISFWTRSYSYSNPLTYDTISTFYNGEMYSLPNQIPSK